MSATTVSDSSMGTWTTEPVMIRSPARSRSPIAPRSLAAVRSRSPRSLVTRAESTTRPLTISRARTSPLGNVGLNGPNATARWKTFVATTEAGSSGGLERSTFSRGYAKPAGLPPMRHRSRRRDQRRARALGPPLRPVKVGVAGCSIGGPGSKNRRGREVTDRHLATDTLAISDTELPAHTLCAIT